MTPRLPLRAVARQAWADRGLLALGLVVLTGVTALATVTPRELDDAATREVRAAVADPGARAGLAVVAPFEDSQVRELRIDTGQQVVDAMGAVLGALPPAAAAVLGDPVGSLVGTQLQAGAVGDTPLLVRPVLLVDGSPAEAASDDPGPGEAASDEPRSWHVTDASAAESGAVQWLRGGAPQGRAPADGLLSTGGGYLLVQPGSGAARRCPTTCGSTRAICPSPSRTASRCPPRSG